MKIKSNLIGDHPHTEEACLERELKWSGKEDAIVATAARLCFSGGDRANFSVNHAGGFGGPLRAHGPVNNVKTV